MPNNWAKFAQLFGIIWLLSTDRGTGQRNGHTKSTQNEFLLHFLIINLKTPLVSFLFIVSLRSFSEKKYWK